MAKNKNKATPTEVATTPTEVIEHTTTITPLGNVEDTETTAPTEVAATTNEVIEISTATTPLENVEDTETIAPTEVVGVLADIETRELAEYFEQNPSAEKVLKVGRCLFDTTQSGAAQDYAKQFDLEIQEITNNGKAK